MRAAGSTAELSAMAEALLGAYAFPLPHSPTR
jgi:hypothetical protein